MMEEPAIDADVPDAFTVNCALLVEGATKAMVTAAAAVKKHLRNMSDLLVEKRDP
jgi:hypothetical protein